MLALYFLTRPLFLLVCWPVEKLSWYTSGRPGKANIMDTTSLLQLDAIDMLSQWNFESMIHTASTGHVRFRRTNFDYRAACPSVGRSMARE